MVKFSDLPLRERKQSKTRLAIFDAGGKLLQEKCLAKIKVEDICEQVDISRGTFFSYFARKPDLIIYAIRLWSIETGWRMARTPKKDLGIPFIDFLFQSTAISLAERPIFWAEIMALRVFEPRTIHRLNQNEISLVTKADRLLRFPDNPGIEDMPEGTIVTYFRKNLAIAIEKKELPEDTNIDATLISLTSLLYGVPLMMAGYTDYETLPKEYDRQLNILWTGLRTVSAQANKKELIME
jgi:AcrR family transcriptional regulator